MKPGDHGLLADLHIHTVASSCAEIEMIPPLIVQQALTLGLRVIAVTDHNSALNVAAVQQAAKDTDLVVWAGIEVQTREEAHIVCLFDSAAQALGLQETLDARLPQEQNPEAFFGTQLVVDARGEFVRKDERLRQAASSLSVGQLVARVQELGGLAIAAHVDRPSYSLLGSLGFVPEELELAALEVSQAVPLEQLPARMGDLMRWPLIRASDAHTLSQMLPCMALAVREPTIAECLMALQRVSGREVTLLA